MITLLHLSQALNAPFILQQNEDLAIAHVLLDSRKLVFTKQALFIAIEGKRNNSHLYLQEVYEAGIRNFVVEKNAFSHHQLDQFPGASILEVESGLLALQTLAKLHRQHFKLEVLAITGSNGKTIVKEWLTHLLKDEVNIVRSPKSYNSQIGVPLSILQIQTQHQLGIFEAGISEPKEMKSLAEIIRPTYGILTLLGDAHEEGFESRSEKLIEKAQLFSHCKHVLYGEEQTAVFSYFEMLNVPLTEKKYLGWSRHNTQADFYIQTQASAKSTELICNGISVQIPFTDEAAIWNACTCFAYLLMRKYDVTKLANRFADLPSLDMRLQLKEAHNNCLLINDSYSADLGSLGIALDFLKQHQAGNKSCVILSDFLESGKSEESLYCAIAKQLEAHQVKQIIGIGPAISRQQKVFSQTESLFFESTQDFIAHFSSLSFSNQLILVKGARSFGFERIIKLLEKKVHQTVFEVNLNALVNNLNVYRNLLQPKVKMMAMVKAFSYGAGSFEIARILSFNRVDYLAVAYADEGVVLRKSGIKTPIMVMNPEPNSFDAILQENLEPEIYHFEILQSLIAAANGVEVGIHLELDSGMKRLGFDQNELPTLIEQLQHYPNLIIKSVFTHLAASEDVAHDAFTLQQILQFQKMAAQIQEAFSYPITRHCLNSGGIARFPQAQFDMVRLGIGLYGVDPSENKLPLQNIGKLKTVVSQIRNISADESIGYGRKGVLMQAGKIAIVAIGYADGLDRRLSNGVGSMLVNGQLAQIVGNVCMDMTMLDVSNIHCKVGDEVIVFGQEPSLAKMSQQLGTIPYEILTGVSQRVKRVYFFE